MRGAIGFFLGQFHIDQRKETVVRHIEFDILPKASTDSTSLKCEPDLELEA